MMESKTLPAVLSEKLYGALCMMGVLLLTISPQVRPDLKKYELWWKNLSLIYGIDMLAKWESSVNSKRALFGRLPPCHYVIAAVL